MKNKTEKMTFTQAREILISCKIGKYADACRTLVQEIESNEYIISRYKDLLSQIAYPQRGTDQENMDINDAAKLIQSNFSMKELE